MNIPETVVVTRHAALVQYLIETGVVSPSDKVIPHATAENVFGRRVVGILPLHLAALAAEVVHIPVDIPAELRGAELDIEQMRKYAKDPEVYVVRDVWDVARSLDRLTELNYYSSLDDCEESFNSRTERRLIEDHLTGLGYYFSK